MKVKKILSRRSLTKHEDKDRRRQRSLRMKSLPDEDAGVVFWEDFCVDNGLPELPTTANIHRYIEVFVNVKEEQINRRRGLSKGDEGYRSGHDLFVKPVLRLMAQPLSTQNAAAKPAIAAHVSPTPSKSSNGNIHADDTSQASTCTVNSNNKRPMPELDTDSENFAEDYDVSHSYVGSGSVGATLNAEDMDDKYPQFKAHEFKVGLSQTSDDIKTYSICREANTVPLVLQEWPYGLYGHDAIQTLNNKFRGKWKCRADKYIYETRLGVVQEYIRLVEVEGHSDTGAIEILEQKRASRSIATLYKDLKKAAPKTEKGKESSVYGKDEPEYPKDLIHQAGRVSRPPPIEETGFPLPVRLLNSISSIWEEWEVGWKGAPSIRSQINKHGRVWNESRFKSEPSMKQ
ncbi:hypothetical protein BGZ95_001149 [Linnemannia exigua]|uniref:Transcription activator GCR1-like domain-containing protein n=1 Tax=Linnemannia exigua TaxID=604196 RepID=A0AAD4D798_9FUNG|nr:hypothetical protein BGZ95_001149 [Linnemannia exigua]